MAFLALITLTAPVWAQMRDNREMNLDCRDNARDERNRVRNCEMREITLGPSGSLEIEPGHNGGITVKGWAQNNVLVRARLEAWAESDSEARNVASQIGVETGGGRIRATGPQMNNSFFRWNENRSWTVSFEIFTPWSTEIRTNSHNGGVIVSDIAVESTSRPTTAGSA
jgi:hypothetical protein